jgi:hypothetical protein
LLSGNLFNQSGSLRGRLCCLSGDKHHLKNVVSKGASKYVFFLHLMIFLAPGMGLGADCGTVHLASERVEDMGVMLMTVPSHDEEV